jgi:hypothetical protein
MDLNPFIVYEADNLSKLRMQHWFATCQFDSPQSYRFGFAGRLSQVFNPDLLSLISC